MLQCYSLKRPKKNFYFYTRGLLQDLAGGTTFSGLVSPSDVQIFLLPPCLMTLSVALVCCCSGPGQDVTPGFSLVARPNYPGSAGTLSGQRGEISSLNWRWWLVAGARLTWGAAGFYSVSVSRPLNSFMKLWILLRLAAGRAVLL